MFSDEDANYNVAPSMSGFSVAMLSRELPSVTGSDVDVEADGLVWQEVWGHPAGHDAEDAGWWGPSTFLIFLSYTLLIYALIMLDLLLLDLLAYLLLDDGRQGAFRCCRHVGQLRRYPRGEDPVLR